MKKRVISILTALALCLGLFPLGTAAAEDGSGPAPNPPADTEPLPAGATINSMWFTDGYIKSLEKPYDAEAAAPPEKGELLFDLLDATDGKRYTLPEGWAYTITPTWYKGSAATEDAKLKSAPIDAGTYTMHLQVQITVPPATETPTPVPTPTEEPTEPTPPEGGTPDPGDAGAGTPTTGAQPVADGDDVQTLVWEGKFTIAPKTLDKENLYLRGDISKRYDGRTTYTVDEYNPTPIDMDRSGIFLRDRASVSVTGNFGFSDPKVGTGKIFTASGLKLAGDSAGNYSIASGTILSVSTAAITRAAHPVPLPENSLILRNRKAQEYTFDLRKLLPPGDFDDATTSITLTAKAIDIQAFFTDAEQDIKIDEEKKLLTVKTIAASYDGPHTVGTLTFLVTSTNYEDFDTTLLLRCDDKTAVNITGLEAERTPYDGTPQQGYTGTPKCVLADPSSGATAPNITTFAYLYESTPRSETDYGPSATPPTEPGTYKVTVSVPESNADYVGEWVGEFAITKATLTIRALDKSIKVDDPVPSLKKPVEGVDFVVEGMAPGHQLRSLPEMEYSPWADSVTPGEFRIIASNAMVPDSIHYNPAITYVPGTLTVTGIASGEKNPFSDVSEAAWYVTAVKYVYSNGLMNGVSASTFGPNMNITRGMMVTILYRMENEPYVWSDNKFTDVKETDYFYDPIRWATYNNIVNGVGNGKFAPSAPLTREQLAVILYNYTRYYKGLSVNKTTNLDQYDDAHMASSWGQRALQWACGERLLTGVNATSIAPKGTAIRAQVATILMRYGTNICPLAPR